MKIQEKWNFSLYYKNENDPQIEKDLRAIETAYLAFAKKYKGKDFTSTVGKLKKALDDFANLSKIINGWKALRYFHLRKDVEMDNSLIQSKLAQFEQRLTLAGNQTTFFTLELGKILPKDQKRFLKDALLKDYHYLLITIFDQARYLLSEKEEQLENLLSQPGLQMWVHGQEKLLSSQTVKFKNQKLPIAKASGLVSGLPIKDRHHLHKEINKVFESISHFAEAEINAIYNFKKIMDNRRGYKNPHSATVLSYENDEKTIDALVALVKKNLKISHRFYKLHAKILGEKKITLADRSVKMGEIKKKFDFPQAVTLVKESFAHFDPKYAEMLEQFVMNGQIDVYPKKNKVGGAYCAGGGDLPTFILLNHLNNVTSVETLAHEMGHAFHSEFSKKQPYHYRQYTMSSAEVASTFFEQLIMDKLEKELDKKDYAILLHNKIMGDVATVFRQIAFFNFELELHHKVRKEGEVSKVEIAKLMNKHLQSYLGDAVEVDDLDGYFFVHLSHMRNFFYVYTYAYGQLISRAMFEKWKKDPSYSKKVEQFLSAGGSKSPKDIFNSIGINTADPKFFEAGLKGIEADIKRLEKLVR